MIEREGERSDLDERSVPGWLRWVNLQSSGCYLCRRILFQSQANGGWVTALKIRGVELTREEQIAHLARCVPERQEERGVRAGLMGDSSVADIAVSSAEPSPSANVDPS